MSLTLIIILTIAIFLVLIIAGLAIVNFSGDELIEKFNQTSQEPTSISPIELANKISYKYFNGKICLIFKPNFLCDCYSSNNVLTLCSQYANEKNLAGLSICAHELGHAFQFKDQSQKMKKYGKKIRLSKILSRIITPLLFVGIGLVIFDKLIFALIAFALAFMFFFVALGVKMSTIKIEKEASQTALKILQEYADLTETELKIAKKFLDSAKQTYVADLLKTMLKWTFLVKK